MIKDFLLKIPILKQLIVLRRHLTKNIEIKQNEQFDKKWNSLYENGNLSLKYELEDNLYINLYQDSFLAKLIYRGVFELEEINYLKSVLKEGDTFVDIGSNIGLFTLYASKRVGENGKVLSFEPSPKTFSRFVENIELNQLNNVSQNQIGLSDKEGELTLNLSCNGMDAWETFAPDFSNKFQNQTLVPVSTLDLRLMSEDKSKIHLVKIDVEGWEKFVLLGGKQFFKEYSPIVMMEFTEENTNAAGYKVTELYDMMKDWGYNWYTIKNGVLVPSMRKLSYPYENLIAKK
jgi:FkbM family methyltransferase